MSRLILLAALFLLFQGCSKKPVVIPEDVISQEQIIPILADIHLAEAMLQLKNLGRNDSTRTIAYGYYNAVFQKHDVTAEQFTRSFNYYVSQPAILTDLYDSVITRLSTQNLKNFQK